VLQFGARGMNSGGEETILARIWWRCSGIWRAGKQEKAWASGMSGCRTRSGREGAGERSVDQAPAAGWERAMCGDLAGRRDKHRSILSLPHHLFY
jgi:hypothetical protein